MLGAASSDRNSVPAPRGRPDAGRTAGTGRFTDGIRQRASEPPGGGLGDLCAAMGASLAGRPTARSLRRLGDLVPAPRAVRVEQAIRGRRGANRRSRRTNRKRGRARYEKSRSDETGRPYNEVSELSESLHSTVVTHPGGG